MVEVEEKDWTPTILLRVMRASLWTLVPALLLSALPEFNTQYLRVLPFQEATLSYLLIVFLVFEFAIQLLHDTIMQYTLSTARSLVFMIFFIWITNGGVISIPVESILEMPLPPGMSIILEVDFKAILGAYLLLSLLSITKNLLQAVNFFSEKEEEPVIPPELP